MQDMTKVQSEITENHHAGYGDIAKVQSEITALESSSQAKEERQKQKKK
ncbi:hypothetical protein WIR89_15440 [Clostridioides difficile]